MNKVRFEDELERKGYFTYTCVGVSMLPLLRQKKDLFTVRKIEGDYKKYDVVLYKRPPNSYVLHRIIKVNDNDYVILGDNCLNKEYNISKSDVLAVMTSFVRNGKEYSTENVIYKLYSRIWYFIYPVRKMVMKAKIVAKKCLRK